MMDWVPLHLSDTREALQRWDTMDERGQWICGYYQGATGALLMGGEPPAFSDGYTQGVSAHLNANEHRERVSKARREAAAKRWERRSHTPQPDANNAIACVIVDANRMHKTVQDNTRQTEQQSSLRSLEKKSKNVPDSDLPPIPPVDAYTDEPPPSVQPPAPDPLDEDTFEDPPPSARRNDKPMKTDARGIVTTREIIDWI